MKSKVSSFSSLKQGWDSYAAMPPSKQSIATVLRFLDILEGLQITPDWVEPTSDNSIMLEVRVGTALEEWDFYSDGEVAVMFEWEDGREESHMVKPTDEELAMFLLKPQFDVSNRS